MDSIIQKIVNERTRQFSLPGSEWDSKNTPSDWISIISHYIGSEVRRNGINPDSDDFENSLVKAAAVIIATLQHLETMKSRNELN